MPKPNPEYNPEQRPGEQQSGDRKVSGGNQHPLVGESHLSPAGEVLLFPKRPDADPMTSAPTDEVREQQHRAFDSTPHDPDIDYHPPNPLLVIPPLSLPLKLVGALTALLLFAVVAGLLFYNWMVPLPRHPGQQKSDPGLEHRIP
jgi:hypothetical protein